MALGGPPRLAGPGASPYLPTDSPSPDPCSVPFLRRSTAHPWPDRTVQRARTGDPGGLPRGGDHPAVSRATAPSAASHAGGPGGQGQGEDGVQALPRIRQTCSFRNQPAPSSGQRPQVMGKAASPRELRLRSGCPQGPKRLGTRAQLRAPSRLQPRSPAWPRAGQRDTYIHSGWEKGRRPHGRSQTGSGHRPMTVSLPLLPPKANPSLSVPFNKKAENPFVVCFHSLQRTVPASKGANTVTDTTGPLRTPACLGHPSLSPTERPGTGHQRGAPASLAGWERESQLSPRSRWSSPAVTKPAPLSPALLGPR